jgi:GNAT superfamily N-acetyltransferase
VTDFVVEAITAAMTRPLRQAILRPHHAADTLVYPHDDDADTLHAGAFVGETLVGTATIHREPPPKSHFPTHALDPSAWRLRGMAIADEMRRKGCGAALVAMCFAHAEERGGTLVWCNARVGAAPFYASLGFAPHGDAFDLPEIGAHYVMSKTISRSRRSTAAPRM